ATDKIQTSQVLLENKIAVPDTLITDSSIALKKFVQEKGLAILKSREGCGGDNHYILRIQQGQLRASISDKSYIVDFANETRIEDGRLILSSPYYAQEFISKSGDKNDEVLRTYVIGSNVPFATIRKKENVRRAEDSIINVAKGAKYSFMPNIPKDLISLSLSTADALGFEIGALDFVQDNRGNFYVLEANLDCYRMLICRKFKQNKDFSPHYDLDYYIAKRLLEIEGGASFRR
ncbi:hypothetical protein HYT26_04410, partial [Candidatus Pacearchaeota archaeon]|nr:hypothetical protein [Candidatus Pacearchaeota archaeon]